MTNMNARWIKKDENSLDVDLLTGELSVKCDPNGPIEKSTDGIKIKDATITENLLDADVFQTSVTPNIISDARYFHGICSDTVNTPYNILSTSAFTYPWSEFEFMNGTTGSGNVEVVDLDNLLNHSINHGGDLEKAVSEYDDGRIGFSGDFNVLFLNVQITSGQSNGMTGMVSLLSQGNYTFSGNSKGEFPIQLSLFANVVSVTGTMAFYMTSLTREHIKLSKNEEGLGWVYHYVNHQNLVGRLRFYFMGIGRMQVAIALPYAGYGKHGSNYVFANSLGRYMFDHDLMPNGQTFNYNVGYKLGVSNGYDDGYANNSFDDNSLYLKIESITGYQVGYKAGYTQGQNYLNIYNTAYAAGETEGSADFINTDPYDDSTSETEEKYILGYQSGYLAGWVTAGGDTPYDMGYAAGEIKGIADCTNTDPYEDSTTETNSDYIIGFQDGYIAGWIATGCTSPYDTGHADGIIDGTNDCFNGFTYDDSTSVVIRGYSDGYKAGYLNGWTTEGCTSPYDSGYIDGEIQATADCNAGEPYNHTITHSIPEYITGYEAGYLYGWTNTGCSGL